MSGDLNASLTNTNPPLHWKERHFLRAQPRIFAATEISPKGYYEIDEETG